MCELVINGGRSLCGEVEIQGSKNAVLPILAGTLLTKEECVIHNCPDICDVPVAFDILRTVGAHVTRADKEVVVRAKSTEAGIIPKCLMESMRSSIMFLGAILSRCGEAVICPPGGCRLGDRPIDIHIASLRKLGARIEQAGDCIICKLDKIKSEDITLLYPSVGATENIMLMCAGSGASVKIYNPAREPEIVDLQNFLNLMGARICGAGTECIVIRPATSLGGASYSIMPDRIVASTYACAVTACGGEVLLKGAEEAHMRLVLAVLREMGAEVIREENGVRVSAYGRPKPIDMLKTLPYPGFPTDVQPMLSVALALGKGTSEVCETIFESRFGYTKELKKMGAKITENKCSIKIEGVPMLYGATVKAEDLRGGASLAVAGAAAEGITVIEGVEYIDRGYENIERDMRAIGAEIMRI